MSGPEIVFYVARSDNNIIGRDGALPWRLNGDLGRFKAMTMGKPMFMGRKTFESLPGPLPGRRHLVLTRDQAWRAQGAEVVHDVEEAVALAEEASELAVIGGAEIFALLMDRATRIELTEVHRTVEGDVRMPPLGLGWRIEKRELGGADWDYVTLRRTL